MNTFRTTELSSPAFLEDVYYPFAESDEGQRLHGQHRWSSYRPPHISSSEWIDILGANSDTLGHHLYSYLLTEGFLATTAEVATLGVVTFTPEEAMILKLVALSNDWAVGTVGDIAYERRTPQDNERERKIFAPIFEKYAPSDLSLYQDDVEDILFGDRNSKLGEAWDAIECISFLQDAMRAFEASKETDDEVLASHLRWLVSGALANQIPLLMKYAKLFPAAARYIEGTEDSIGAAFESLDSSIFAAHGQRERPKVQQFEDARRSWFGRKTSEASVRPVRISNLERVRTTELFDRMREITFRGLYDENGDLLRPYKDAKLSIATIHPQNTMTSSPMLVQGTREEPVWTPQPTIYGDQTDIIRTVWAALEQAGYNPLELVEAISYDWREWDIEPHRYTIMPPVVERQQFRLKQGAIDLDHLASLFKGTYIKDRRGFHHELSQRFLTDFYIDPFSTTPPHFDIFHPDLPLVNYGPRYDGDWNFAIVCDGAHRLDIALEYTRQPIKVILAEPGGADAKPLTPYYAIPMPFQPNMRLTSKEAEGLHPNLPRDKWHLLNDVLKKRLHYDWTRGDLNVSSLRSKPKGM